MLKNKKSCSKLGTAFFDKISNTLLLLLLWNIPLFGHLLQLRLKF